MLLLDPDHRRKSGPGQSDMKIVNGKEKWPKWFSLLKDGGDSVWTQFGILFGWLLLFWSTNDR